MLVYESKELIIEEAPVADLLFATEFSDTQCDGGVLEKAEERIDKLVQLVGDLIDLLPQEVQASVVRTHCYPWVPVEDRKVRAEVEEEGK